MSKASWGIVMTVREPAQLVLANVHYHLSHGASEVHVFLDDPEDPVAELLEGVDGCLVYRCDQKHWERINRGRQPPRQVRRQSLNATSGYQQSSLDWLIHMDADEFIFQKRSLTEELTYTPRTPGFVALPVRERAYIKGQQESLFDGSFRVPFEGSSSLEPALFGEIARFMNNGVLGHASGKSCNPTGQNLNISIHAPRNEEGDRIPALYSTSSVLLHFDGLTRLHWMTKMLRYDAGNPKGMVGRNRMVQLDFIQNECSGLEDIGDFHDKLKSVSDDQNERMTALGLLEHLPFDVGDRARAAVEAAGLSLTAQSFDDDVRLRNADILDTFRI